MFAFKASAALLLAALLSLSVTLFGQTSSGEVNGATVKLIVFNIQNYAEPSALTINTNATQTAAGVGRVTALASGATPRQMQFGLRLAF